MINLRNLLSRWYKQYKYYRFTHQAKFKIASTQDTIDYIVSHRCSVSRYGDGEFDVAFGVSKYFQKADPKLVSRLNELVNVSEQGYIVCLPLGLLTLKNVPKDTQMHWRSFVRYNGDKILNLLKKSQYFDTWFTRFYMDFEDRSGTDAIVNHLKRIWEGRDVYIIEGETTRFGEGNDFLVNAKSISRILCPSRNAFAKYDEILSVAEEKIPKDENVLVLIALGMTATIMAYDLHKLGYQAIDIGHADIEYSWWKMKAQERCPVPGKATFEAGAYEGIGDVDDDVYKKQIIAEIK